MSREIRLLLAGDALLTRPWSHVRDAGFLGLIEEIRDADVAIANLETVIHEFKGHAQADSGGTYMAFGLGKTGYSRFDETSEFIRRDDK